MTIVDIMKDLLIYKCCMNCIYYYVNDYRDDSCYCSIDKELIHPNISHIIKCNAFELWFGSM